MPRFDVSFSRWERKGGSARVLPYLGWTELCWSLLRKRLELTAFVVSEKGLLVVPLKESAVDGNGKDDKVNSASANDGRNKREEVYSFMVCIVFYVFVF